MPSVSHEGQRSRRQRPFSIGGDGDDYLNGDANGSLFGNARGGDDVLIGGSGNGTAYGDDYLFGSAVGGNDLLRRRNRRRPALRRWKAYAAWMAPGRR